MRAAARQPGLVVWSILFLSGAAISQSREGQGAFAGAEAPLRVGSSAHGEISDGSSVVRSPALDSRRSESPVRGASFTLEIVESGQVTIQHRSHFFDAYLVVEDEAGQVLGEDDDGWIGTHSRITARLAPARYVVRACALHGGTGPFELAVHVGPGRNLAGPARREAEIEDAREAVAAREHADSASPELGAALDRLGSLLWREGRYEEAVPMMSRALEIAKAWYGPEDHNTAAAEIQLAAQYQGMGRYDDAEPLYLRALKSLEPSLGADHPDVMLTRNNLALLYDAQGRWDDAEKLYVRSIELYEARLGPDHPETARGLNGLANLYESRGRFAEAAALHERALAIRESALGPDHHLTGVSLHNLAMVYESRGRLGEAEALYLRSLEICESVNGPDHPETAKSLNSLALFLETQGRYEDAARLHRRALEIMESVLGPRHPRTANCLRNIALMYHAMARHSEAEPLLARALEITETTLGADHPETAVSLNDLALLYNSIRKYTEAEALLVRALKISEESNGPTHHHTASILSNLATAVEAQGRLEEAEKLHVRSLGISETIFGANHPETAGSANNLAVFYRSAGRYQDAEPHFRRALEIHESSLGPTDPRIATSLDNLAALYDSMGRDERAQPLYQRALRIREKVLGREHPDTAKSLINVALQFHAQGRHERALPLMFRALDGGADRLARELLTSPDVRRLSIAGTQADAVDWALSVWSELERPRPEAEAIYRRIREWKGVAFRAATRFTRALAAAGDDLELTQLRRDLSNLDGQLSVLAYAQRIDDLDAHRARLLDLQEQRRKTQTALLTRLGLGPKLGTARRADLSDALPPESAALDYFIHHPWSSQIVHDGEVIEQGRWGKPRVLCFVTVSGSDGASLVDLGDAATLRAAVDSWLDRLTHGRRGARPPVGDDERAAGEGVRRLLLDPITATLPSATNRLFVIPDGFIGEIPFGALSVGEKRCLLELVDIVYATDAISLHDLLEVDARPDDSAPALLAVGGVDYDDRALMSEGVATRSRPSSEPRGERAGFSRKWGPLASTTTEVEGIAKELMENWPDAAAPELLRSTAATEEAVKAAASGRSILHFATHGFFQRDGLGPVWRAAIDRARDDLRPRGLGEMSKTAGEADGAATPPFANMSAPEGDDPGMLAGLALAGANLDPNLDPARDDGLLTATEVSSLDLSACRLAVLSACQSSLGASRAGEGLQSLRRGFHEAGADSVVASLWKVDDVITQRLMHTFYEELWKNGRSVSDALRRARLAIRRENEDPYYWAAFTLSGEWR